MRTWAQLSHHTRSYATIINPSKKRVISFKPEIFCEKEIGRGHLDSTSLMK